MSLVTCDDCSHQVSEKATACPSCGAPMKPRCPHYGERAVEKVEGLQGGKEITAGLILFAFLLLPGLAYYFDRQRLPYCTSCKRRVPKSLIAFA